MCVCVCVCARARVCVCDNIIFNVFNFSESDIIGLTTNHTYV